MADPGERFPRFSSGPPTDSMRAVRGPSALDILKSAQLFRNFTDAGLALLASIAQEKVFEPYSTLFVQSMAGEALYVIGRGKVRVSLRRPDGRELALVELGPGDSLGEVSLLRIGPRLASATAYTEVVAAEIGRRDFWTLHKSKPQACMKLLMRITDVLGERAREITPDLVRFVG